MDRKETAERIKIMQAFVDGKQIEFKDCMGRWCEAKNPLWNWDSEGKYRIKPEPKYRPFKDAEECWQQMKKHEPFGWIRNKKTKEYELLQRVAPKNGVIDQYACAFKRWVFADGSAFGIKEE